MADELNAARRELADSHAAWRAGNAGRARVSARRSAGMAIRVWIQRGSPTGFGTNFMHHLNALADLDAAPLAVREAAWRLAARAAPAEGFQAPLPEPLTPAADAQQIIDWVD